MVQIRKRVLFILSNVDKIGPRGAVAGYEFSEAAHPYLIFRDAGYAVDFASPLGGAVTESGYNKLDSASRMFRSGKGFEALSQSLKLSDIEVDNYVAVFVPGGLGPMVDLVADASVKKLIARAYECGKVVGAVCHGPAALLGTKLANGSHLLSGKRITSFTTAEEKGHSENDVPFMLDEALMAEGAIHTHAAPFDAHVVVDQRLVTGQNPASALGVGATMVALLSGVEHGRHVAA